MQAIEQVLGSRIAHRTPAPWGSKNRTTFADLDDGRRVVLQFYAHRDAAAVRLRAAQQLAEPLNQHGVPVPRVIACDLIGPSPWAVYERLSGEPGYVAAGDDLSGENFPAVARDMGTLVRRFRGLDPDAFDLPRLWSDPAALVPVARAWLARLGEHLSSADTTAARGIVDDLPSLFAGRRPVVCHGDFGPQNVLVLGDRVSGLLDLEDARIADPLLDVAWWVWLVRAHTPLAFARSWSGFLDAADVDPGQASFDERLLSLIVLRLLETAEAYRHSVPAKYPSWGGRLSQTLGWGAEPLT